METPLPHDLGNFKRYGYGNHVCIHREARNKKAEITGLICKSQTKVRENLVLGNVSSRHGNLTKFCRITNIDFKNLS